MITVTIKEISGSYRMSDVSVRVILTNQIGVLFLLFLAMVTAPCNSSSLQTSVSELRSQCAEYIRSHSDEFLPYLTDPDTGNQFTQGTCTCICMTVCIIHVVADS